MYITNIKLNKIRCFEEANINFGENHSSIAIAGNNGTGKTAMLRSLAMGICDEASAAGLLRDLEGDFTRHIEESENIEKTEDASIEVELISPISGDKWIIETKLELDQRLNIERVHQDYYLNEKSDEHRKRWSEFPWDELFVVAYGAGLRTKTGADYESYVSSDAVYTLFVYDYPLQAPQQTWLRMTKEIGRASCRERV